MLNFQECPGCECLIPFLHYAEIRLPTRTVHLLHCEHCAVVYVLSVYPEGRCLMLDCRPGTKAYRNFLRALREAHRVRFAKDLQAALAA